MKICAECRWVRGQDDHPMCDHPRNRGKISRINGREIYKRNYCKQHREDGYFDSWVHGTCGARGRWFEKHED